MPSNDDLTRRDFASTAAGALSVLGALGAHVPLAAQTGDHQLAPTRPSTLSSGAFSGWG